MLTGEEMQMLVEILNKADFPVHIISCQADRCVHCVDHNCTATEVEIEIDEEGSCMSYVPSW